MNSNKPIFDLVIEFKKIVKTVEDVDKAIIYFGNLVGGLTEKNMNDFFGLQK